MNANNDRVWCEFLDMLTGRTPTHLYISEIGRWRGNVNAETGDNEFDNEENWRDGTMRDGMRRVRRERP